MNLTIRLRSKTDLSDMDFFYELGYKSIKKTLYSGSEESDEILFKKFVDSLGDVDFTDPDCKIFIVENEKKEKIGFIWVNFRNVSSGMWDFDFVQPVWIFHIAVDDKYRGKGIGKKLILHAEEYAKKKRRNIGLFVHASNKTAITLYRKMGFENKAIPLTKLNIQKADLKEDKYHIRLFVEEDKEMIKELSYNNIKKYLSATQSFSDEELEEEHQLHTENYLFNEYSRILICEDEHSTALGYICFGPAHFDKTFGMIHDFVIKTEINGETIKKRLLQESINYLVKKDNITKLHILLNGNDEGLTIDFFLSNGFKTPGFFLEKKLF